MNSAMVRTPRWVWAVILVLAASQPVVHLLTAYDAPEETMATGLHIPDSALFLYSMDMFSSGFHSDYATCMSDVGDASIRFYAVPHLWLYGVLGMIVRWLPGNPFLSYGLANGLGALLYLWVVFRFLCVVVPRYASSAFLLFALSGGPGGALYILTGFLGLHDHPLFESYFYRFGVYDLMEGPHFHPVLYFPRLYYTLSLSGCLWGLRAAIRRIHGHDRSQVWPGSLALAAASFLDARFAAFSGGLLVLYVLCQDSVPYPEKRRALLSFGIPAAAGFFLALALMRSNPAVIGNHREAGAMAMWFSPLVVVTWLHWLAAGRPCFHAMRSGTPTIRLLLGAGTGYLIAYAVGYLIYQTYYGNLLAGRDGTVAGAVSDWALMGALIGVCYARWNRWKAGAASDDVERAHIQWLTLWLVGYTAIALSGFVQGWFLQFGPQRVQVFLWLPLCTLAAVGLTGLPKLWRRCVYTILLACGISSIAVATIAFQSPLGRAAARGPYAVLHPEVMHVIDRGLQQAIGEGTVLAPPPASDIIVHMHGNPTVFGIGSFNLTDRPHEDLQVIIDSFFSPETDDETRRAIARDWCVDWIYCPHTWPVNATTRAQLLEATWLELVAQTGDGLVLKVRLN